MGLLAVVAHVLAVLVNFAGAGRLDGFDVGAIALSLTLFPSRYFGFVVGSPRDLVVL